jgi:hypothetical protein
MVARATYQDLLEVPDRFIAEPIEGELFTSPRPRPREALTTSNLCGLLAPAYGFTDRDPVDGSFSRSRSSWISF